MDQLHSLWFLFGSKDKAGCKCVHSPLPGDQVDVVSQGGVVFGQLFGGSVLTGVFGFGGVGVGQRSQADQHAQHHGHQHRPRLQHHGHLRGAQHVRDKLWSSSVYWFEDITTERQINNNDRRNSCHSTHQMEKNPWHLEKREIEGSVAAGLMRQFSSVNLNEKNTWRHWASQYVSCKQEKHS